MMSYFQESSLNPRYLVEPWACMGTKKLGPVYPESMIVFNNKSMEHGNYAP